MKNLLASVEKHAGVVGVIIFENLHAQVIYTSLVDRNVAQRYAQSCKKLCNIADEGLSEISERDKARVIRIRSHEHELVIKPDSEFTLVVLQDPVAASK